MLYTGLNIISQGDNTQFHPDLQTGDYWTFEDSELGPFQLPQILGYATRFFTFKTQYGVGIRGDKVYGWGLFLLSGVDAVLFLHGIGMNNTVLNSAFVYA